LGAILEAVRANGGKGSATLKRLLGKGTANKSCTRLGGAEGRYCADRRRFLKQPAYYVPGAHVEDASRGAAFVPSFGAVAGRRLDRPRAVKVVGAQVQLCERLTPASKGRSCPMVKDVLDISCAAAAATQR